MLKGWSDDLVLCTDGVSTLSEDESRLLSKNNISIREERIVRVEEKNGQLENTVFANGETLTRKAIFIRPMAVCPAGEDVIGPYLASKRDFTDDVVRPLQAKREPVYVVRGSDAEAHVQKRYSHKTVRHVRNSSRPRNIASLLFGLRISFQRHAAGKLNATYQFVFTGNESAEATVMISEGKIKVENGLLGNPNLKIIADSETWLGFLAGERNLLWALLTRRVRLQGNPKWLLALKRCFPS
jgi:hypothetical protein